MYAHIHIHRETIWLVGWFVVSCNGIKHTIKSAKSVKWEANSLRVLVSLILHCFYLEFFFKCRSTTTAQITFINSNSLIIVEFFWSRLLTSLASYLPKSIFTNRSHFEIWNTRRWRQQQHWKKYEKCHLRYESKYGNAIYFMKFVWMLARAHERKQLRKIISNEKTNNNNNEIDSSKSKTNNQTI